MDNKKTAFLILRVGEAFKKRIVHKARSANKGISEFVRGLLEKII